MGLSVLTAFLSFSKQAVVPPSTLLAGHLAYILFVIIGGLFALRWRRIALLHLPAAVWGILIEIMGWICPLKPCEVKWRIAAGEAGYDGGFIEHYLIPVIYPTRSTRGLQLSFATIALFINVAVYVIIVSRWITRSSR